MNNTKQKENLDGKQNNEMDMETENDIEHADVVFPAAGLSGVASITPLKMGKLNERAMEGIQEEDRHIEALKEILRSMARFCKTKKNMFREITNSLEKAEDTIDMMGRHRKAWKAALNNIDQLEARRAGRRRMGSTSSVTFQTPKADEKRKRALDTPSSTEAETRGPYKRSQMEGDGGWIRVPSRAKERKKPPEVKPRTRTRVKPDAVIIRPAVGSKYADVLRNIKQKVKPEDMGIKVTSVRETRQGDVLVELGSNTGDWKKILGDVLRTAVGDGGSVRQLAPRITLEIMDVDETTGIEEIRAALTEVLGNNNASDIRIGMSKKSFRGNLIAYVELEASAARKVISEGHIKIGWVRCRVRQKQQVSRCYRCHGYGHQSAGCASVDRSKLCFRCGQEGHKAADCPNEPKCYLCAERGYDGRVDHIPGTSRCKVYRDAAGEKTTE